jgi:uncharacterized protein (DUF433 family)/DNA-binding transcriptional MerR regulator
MWLSTLHGGSVMISTAGGDGAMDDWSAERLEPNRGVYNAQRAAALAGVQKPTLHYWARTGIYQPSIALGPRDRLWSWGDLLALRAIDWFRRKKEDEGLPHASMQHIRQALEALDRRGLSRAQLGHIIALERGGRLVLQLGELPQPITLTGQAARNSFLTPVQPYNHAPHLLEPRPLLRIRPGKLHGEPHVFGTRVPTATIFELARMGYGLHEIRAMYPAVDLVALQQAIEFEQSLLEPRAA